MNQQNNRKWKILSWNVRGLNAPWKWNPIRNKVNEAQCDIICFQETKMEFIDSTTLRNFCPLNLIATITYLQLGPQVASSLLGKETSSPLFQYSWRTLL